MQMLIIAGTITRSGELRRGGKDPVLNFSVVVDNGKDANGNRRDGTFYDCAIWGKRGEALEAHMTKGKKVTIQGRPTVRVHDGKAYQGCTVDDFTFQGGGDREPDRQQSSGGQSSGYGAGGRPGGDLDDDTIPFAPCVL